MELGSTVNSCYNAVSIVGENCANYQCNVNTCLIIIITIIITIIMMIIIFQAWQWTTNTFQLPMGWYIYPPREAWPNEGLLPWRSKQKRNVSDPAILTIYCRTLYTMDTSHTPQPPLQGTIFLVSFWYFILLNDVPLNKGHFHWKGQVCQSQWCPAL